MILVVAETREGELTVASCEAMAAAQATGRRVAVVLMGADAGDALSELARLDVVEVIFLQHEELAMYTADGFTSALAALVRELNPACVLLPHTYQTRDYAPRLAARLGCALIPDCIALGVDGDAWRFTRPMYGGKISAEVVVDGAPPCVATLQTGVFAPDAARPAPGPVPTRTVRAELDGVLIRQRPEPPFRESRPTVDLGHAERIVAVGRGIKTREQLPVAEALAAALDAELAASRPLCDAGWLPMDRQVGSSGQTVRPKLYVAVGVSGAIQHVVGMRGAKTIVAINNDADAPIFEIADYGIVGDLFEIVPAMVAALKA